MSFILMVCVCVCCLAGFTLKPSPKLFDRGNHTGLMVLHIVRMTQVQTQIPVVFPCGRVPHPFLKHTRSVVSPPRCYRCHCYRRRVHLRAPLPPLLPTRTYNTLHWCNLFNLNTAQYSQDSLGKIGAIANHVCPAGQYCPASRASPEPCPVGTYRPSEQGTAEEVCTRIRGG